MDEEGATPPRSKGENSVEAEIVTTVDEGVNFGEEGTTTWLVKRPVWHPNSEGKSLQ